MKKINNYKNGFTLLEVLITLSVLSISMLGVYSLLQMSLDTTAYAKDKMFVIERGYDRLTMMMAYPSKVYSDEEEYDGIEIRYTFERESTPIPGVEEVQMTVETDYAEAVFVYYEETGQL